MNTKEINETHSLLNISNNFDPLLAEREIRAAAQQELAKAIVRSIKVGLNNIASVLKEATELQRKYESRKHSTV